jgi:DNA-binding response OmpR family regulator
LTSEKKKILLVEDEDNIALALEFLISRQGFDLHRVSDGKQALRVLSGDLPDLVVLDLRLPDRSGYEILQHIRNTEPLKVLKVLLMTASGGEIEQRKGLALGADEFMTKPFDTTELTRKICQMLGEEYNG